MSINNPSFFNQIDSEEKAYWLGFLAADGAISRGRRLEITLSIVDLEHLMKLRDALDSDNKISIITTGKPNGRTGKPSPLKGAKYVKIINAATGEIEKKYIPAPKAQDGS